jgi:hypothetical protein
MRSESTEQTIFVARVRQFHPEILMMSIPNGGKRDPRTAAQMKREGVLPGAPDLFVAEKRDGKAGLFIEMKRADGSTSKSQKELHPQLVLRGYAVEVCRSADEAYGVFLRYVYGPQWIVLFPHAKATLARTGVF